jgi:peptide/nickel transport system substrate-binding protein
MTVLSRRALALGSLGALLGWPAAARALGRTPLGGRLAFSVPWSLASIDPHDLASPGGALFSGALFDTLVVPDPRLGFRPALVEALPAAETGLGTVIRLRPALRTASGAFLDGRDVVASIRRARAGGGAAVLDALKDVSVHPKEPLTVLLKANPSVATRALASPLAAIVPRGFDPARPDGTGPFAASRSGGNLVLTRNVRAAMGASFLDELVISEAGDLQESLRDFEAGRHDLGWLGLGLFNSRANAQRFELGSAGLLVVAASGGAGNVDRAGALQRLVDLLPRARLAHLGLGALPDGSDAVAWDGEPIDVWADSRSAHLGEIAKALADILSRPSHEVRVRRGTGGEIMARRRRGEPMLSCHVVRPTGPGPSGLAMALGTFDDPSKAGDIATRPPRGTTPREIARELKVAVLGELRLSGGVIPGIKLAKSAAGGWDLGATFKKKA